MYIIFNMFVIVIQEAKGKINPKIKYAIVMQVLRKFKTVEKLQRACYLVKDDDEALRIIDNLQRLGIPIRYFKVIE